MSKPQEIRLPDIGDFDAVEIIEISVGVGDKVEAEETLLTLESDKATMDIPSPMSGEIVKVLVNVGDEITKDTLIFMLQSSDVVQNTQQTIPEPVQPAISTSQDNSTIERSKQSPAKEVLQQRPPPKILDSAQKVGHSYSEQAHASPSVRRFARELGVDLGLVSGSGRKGRITQSDVMAFTKAVMSDNRVFEKEQSGFAAPKIPPIDFSKFGEVETLELSKLRRLSGQNLHRSWITVPHVTQFDSADITELEAFRQSKKSEAEKYGTRLTLLSFLIKAVVVALKKYPEFNASLSADGEHLIIKQYYHIGVAVNTPSGLMVPVLKDADKKGLFDLASELEQLAQKARDKKLSPAEMQGGCFSISSLGHIGGTGFTPIVNAPEVAIMGVSRSSMQPVYQNGQFEPRLILPFSLSYDHRVIDGVAAAEFTREISLILTDIRDILL